MITRETPEKWMHCGLDVYIQIAYNVYKRIILWPVL